MMNGEADAVVLMMQRQEVLQRREMPNDRAVSVIRLSWCSKGMCWSRLLFLTPSSSLTNDCHAYSLSLEGLYCKTGHDSCWSTASCLFKDSYSRIVMTRSVDQMKKAQRKGHWNGESSWCLLFICLHQRKREREELMTSCQVEESLPLNLTGRDDYLRQTVLAWRQRKSL